MDRYDAGDIPFLEPMMTNFTDAYLNHWGRVTHICVSKITIIGSDNGLAHGRRQAALWTNAGILLIGPLGTNFSEILIEIHTFSLKKMHLKLLSAKWRPFCLGLDVLTSSGLSGLIFQSKILFPFFSNQAGIHVFAWSSMRPIHLGGARI